MGEGNFLQAMMAPKYFKAMEQIEALAVVPLANCLSYLLIVFATINTRPFLKLFTGINSMTYSLVLYLSD